MENKNSERENYIKWGLVVSVVCCFSGLAFQVMPMAIAGAIMMCLTQVIDIVWYLKDKKFKDSKNLKQAFCRCRDVEIVNEWDNVDTKFGRCVRCGKYIMINEKLDAYVKINEEEYKHHVQVFNTMSNSMKGIKKAISSLEIDIKEIFENSENEIDYSEKENKE